MIYSLLADLVLLLHLGFILFAGFGGLLLLRWPRLSWLHIPALAWALWISVTSSICPLTPLEQSLRQHAGEGGYRGGFIAHYIEPLIYPVGLTVPGQRGIGVILLLFNAVIYLRLYLRWRRRDALR